jgi:hypothetical protein
LAQTAGGNPYRHAESQKVGDVRNDADQDLCSDYLNSFWNWVRGTDISNRQGYKEYLIPPAEKRQLRCIVHAMPHSFADVLNISTSQSEIRSRRSLSMT